MNNVNNVNIATAIYAVVHELDKYPLCLNGSRKDLFVLSNISRAKQAADEFSKMLILHDIEISHRDSLHIYTKYGGTYTFASIRSNVDFLRGTMVTNLYMDLSMQDHCDYESNIELILLTKAYALHRSDYIKHDKYENNTANFLYNCWSRSRWWIHKGWKNTMEMLRGSKKVQRNNDW